MESQEYAERPKDDELWMEMIERQQKEGNNQEGYRRELLRSLPDEQKQEKEQERGDAFDSLLAEASQRGRQPENELER